MTTTYESTTVPSADASPRKTFRPDIQGLRMLAVVAVILDHLLGWPGGGFVGVDIFFVISGFLITSLLLREHNKTGTISFVGFYRRRVKRILPASTLVLVVTVIAAFLVFNTGRAVQTLWDSTWALLFAANWRFALDGTDYFQGAGPVSPLQHFWSLAVEEQFYFVWPWLMLLIFVVGERSSRWKESTAYRAVAATMIALIAISFGWALWESVANPTLAYFSTFSRAWELGIGALVAVAAPILAHLPGWSRPVLGWLGLVGVIASLFVVHDGIAFPGPWAAFPVLATAVVIAAGTGGEQRFLWPLTNPISGYLGDISYSLYLWHFPVVIILAVVLPSDSLAYLLIGTAGILALSILSFHFVEDPIRNSAWLSGQTASERASTKRRRRRSVRSSNSRMVVGGIAALGIVVAALLVVALLPRVPTSVYQRPDTAVQDPGTAVVDDASTRLAAEVTAALGAESWPELTPAISTVSKSDNAPEWVVDGCLAGEIHSQSNAQENALRCVYGDPDAPNTVVVLGDSESISWVPGIRAALPSDWAIHVFTMQQCPVADVPIVKVDGSPFASCAEFRTWTMGQVQQMKPQLVVVSSSFHSLRRLASGTEGAQANSEYHAGLLVSLDTITSATERTVVLAPPPTGKHPRECVTAFSGPSDCIGGVSGGYAAIADAEADAAESFSDRGASYQRTAAWMCSASGKCPGFVGGTTVRTDSTHLTAAFSASLAEVLRAALLPQATP